MRNFEERKAEVFRRSENRIRERKRKRKQAFAIFVPLCLFLAVISITVLQNIMPQSKSNRIDGSDMHDDKMDLATDASNASDNINTDGYDDFTFSLTWNTYGISHYDSASGELIKTTHATNPKDYITTLHLSKSQKDRIWKLILNLDIEEYPDEYNPQKDGLTSKPSMTLVLTVRIGERIKTVKAKDIALSYTSDDPKGQKFLTACKGIEDVITSTSKWKSLPEYEFFYD